MGQKSRILQLRNSVRQNDGREFCVHVICLTTILLCEIGSYDTRRKKITQYLIRIV